MMSFRGIEAQRVCQCGQNFGGGAYIPALLKPCVPSGSHTSQQRDLFATQSRCSSTEAVRKSHTHRGQSLATRAQEVPELSAATFAAGCTTVHRANHSRIDTRIRQRLFSVLRTVQIV